MFDDHFDVYLADNFHGKEIYYQLRYQIFCEELRYKELDFLNKCEFDHWDQHAVHLIVRHKATGHWVGGMRLIHHINGQLPILEQDILDTNPNADELEHCVEISRLCLTKNIRNYLPKSSSFEMLDNVAHIIDPKTLSRNSIAWGMFRAAALFSQKNNIKTWYFLTYRGMARMISTKGFTLKPQGRGTTNHRGERFPYKIEVSNIFEQIKHTKADEFSLNNYDRSYQLFSDSDLAKEAHPHTA